MTGADAAASRRPCRATTPRRPWWRSNELQAKPVVPDCAGDAGATAAGAGQRQRNWPNWPNWPAAGRAGAGPAEMDAAHGTMPGAGFAVIAYGSVGGRRARFRFRPRPGVPARCARRRGLRWRPAAGRPRYFARLAQKLVGLLGTVTAAGRLYEVDVRLRPDGAKGVLVSSLQSFAALPATRAWTWEQQALVRARAARAMPTCARASSGSAARCLHRRTGPAGIAADVIAMRRRMREELDRSEAVRTSTSSRARAAWSTWNS